MLVNTMDDDGNFIELGGEFPLEENEHFNNIPVNTMQSDVQVPTNVYNKGVCDEVQTIIVFRPLGPDPNLSMHEIQILNSMRD